MARLEGTANRTTIEFRAAWDIAATKARFRLVEKLLRWCRSRDPDVSLKAIALALNYRYSKPATQINLDAPAQMALAWDDTADDAVLQLAKGDHGSETVQH